MPLLSFEDIVSYAEASPRTAGLLAAQLEEFGLETDGADLLCKVRVSAFLFPSTLGHRQYRETVLSLLSKEIL